MCFIREQSYDSVWCSILFIQGSINKCVCLFRVFLRAINTYADTMNHKFLNNDDFEVQVRVFASVFTPKAESLPLLFKKKTKVSNLLCLPLPPHHLVVEQLLPLSGGVYYPGVSAASAFLADQKEQDSCQVRGGRIISLFTTPALAALRKHSLICDLFLSVFTLLLLPVNTTCCLHVDILFGLCVISPTGLFRSRGIDPRVVGK